MARRLIGHRNSLEYRPESARQLQGVLSPSQMWEAAPLHPLLSAETTRPARFLESKRRDSIAGHWFQWSPRFVCRWHQLACLVL